MSNLAKITILSGILCPMVAGAIASPAQAQPLAAPNVQLKVQRTSGTCPQTVGLWWLVLPYEGGAEHTVIADTKAFADTTQLVTSKNQHFVEFVSPLRNNYATCVAQTQAQEYPFYHVQFKNKKAYFRVDLRKIQTPDTLISYKTVAASRPYVIWAIAD